MNLLPLSRGRERDFLTLLSEVGIKGMIYTSGPSENPIFIDKDVAAFFMR